MAAHLCKEGTPCLQEFSVDFEKQLMAFLYCYACTVCHKFHFSDEITKLS